MWKSKMRFKLNLMNEVNEWIESGSDEIVLVSLFYKSNTYRAISITKNINGYNVRIDDNGRYKLHQDLRKINKFDNDIFKTLVNETMCDECDEVKTYIRKAK